MGADAAAHLVNEVPRPSWDAPLAMVLSCTMGGTCGVIILITFLAAVTNPDEAVKPGVGAFLVVIDQSLNSKVGTILLSLLVAGSTMFTIPAVNLTANHMIQAFAKDHGLPRGGWLGSTSERLETPV